MTREKVKEAVAGSQTEEKGKPRRVGRLAREIARQVVGGVVTLLVISMVTFAATNVRSPEEIAKSALGIYVSPSQVAAFVQVHGLDKPVFQRYGIWLGKFVRGDFGTSAITARPVRQDVLPRLTRTLVLAIAALLIATAASLGLGVYFARRPDTIQDSAALVGTVVMQALPEFVVGVVLLYLLTSAFHVLPATSTAAAAGSLGAAAKAYVLPTFTLAFTMSPYMIRMTRLTSRAALATPYVQAAALRGLSRRRVIWGHAMPNAAIPLVNGVSLNLVYALSGVIVVETVFAFPGIGQELVGAIGSGDTFAVQAIAMLMGAMFIGINLLADLGVVLLNPRLRNLS